MPREALDKDGLFAEGLSVAHGKEFFENKSAHFLCRGPLVEVLSKDWVFAEGLTVALRKEYFEKNSAQFLCRGPAVEALGKDSIMRNGAIIVTFFAEGHVGPWQRLCRLPDKRLSAKAIFTDSKIPESSLPRAALDKEGASSSD